MDKLDIKTGTVLTKDEQEYIKKLMACKQACKKLVKEVVQEWEGAYVQEITFWEVLREKYELEDGKEYSLKHLKEICETTDLADYIKKHKENKGYKSWLKEKIFKFGEKKTD